MTDYQVYFKFNKQNKSLRFCCSDTEAASMSGLYQKMLDSGVRFNRKKDRVFSIEKPRVEGEHIYIPLEGILLAEVGNLFLR